MSSAQLRGVTIDCDDPQSLAQFYEKLTGMTVGFSSGEYVALTTAATLLWFVKQLRPHFRGAGRCRGRRSGLGSV